MHKSVIDKPPGTALRLGLRLPICLYRLGLGWLLGKRFLMLTHRGRSSGLPHQTVIEVVAHDRDTQTYFVVSGWGEKADWYKNSRKDPFVTIQVGMGKFRGYAEFIPLEEAVPILEAYVHEHPIAVRELSRLFLGKHVRADSRTARQLAEKMPMIAFHVVQPES